MTDTRHAAQAVAVLLLANDFALPVTATYLQGPPGVADPEHPEDDTIAVRLTDGSGARLRCVAEKDFIAAAVWETGSDAHLAELAGVAGERGLRLDRFGLWRGHEPVALEREEALYSALGQRFRFRG